MEVNDDQPQRLDGRGRGRSGDAKARRLQALQLRLGGATYEQIARHLGYRSTSGAHKAVHTELDAQLADKADDVRKLELARLDAVTRQHLTAAVRGDHKATLSLLRIMERRAKYLNLDNPRLTDAVVDATSLLSALASQLDTIPDTYQPVDDESGGGGDAL